MELLAVIQTKIFIPLIKLLFILATVVFLWGVIEFIAGANSEDKLKKGKLHMIWGVIGMAIMLSAGGIIQILQDFFAGL